MLKEINFTSNRKFGVELEFNFPKCSIIANIVRRCGESCNVTSYEHSVNNSTWIAKTDHCGYELVTRVMSGYQDIQKLGEVVRALNDSSPKPNYSRSCGLHVHINVADINDKQITNLVAWWIKFEHIMFSMLPDNRRSNTFCQSVNSIHYVRQSNGSYDLVQLRRKLNFRGALNLLNVGHVNSSRIEFRLGSMSTDAEYIKAWVRLLIWIVEIGKNMPAPTNLNWFTIKQFIRWLGLMNDQKQVIEKRFSTAVLSIRNLIISQLQVHSNINLEKVNQELTSMNFELEQSLNEE